MDIERLAVCAVIHVIARTDYLSPFVNSGDKEICGGLSQHKRKWKYQYVQMEKSISKAVKFYIHQIAMKFILEKA